MPVMAPITKLATTIGETSRHRRGDVHRGRDRRRPHRGPVFVDIPIDVIYDRATVTLPDRAPPPRPDADADAVLVLRALIATARTSGDHCRLRRVLRRGMGGAARCRRMVARTCVLNGLGRGCLPPDHELAFSSSARCSNARPMWSSSSGLRSTSESASAVSATHRSRTSSITPTAWPPMSRPRCRSRATSR